MLADDTLILSLLPSVNCCEIYLAAYMTFLLVCLLESNTKMWKWNFSLLSHPKPLLWCIFPQ